MSGIKGTHERPTLIDTATFKEADFTVYVARINAKRLSNRIQTKYEKEQHILTSLEQKCTSIKSNITPSAIKRKVKQTCQAHTILHFLTRITKGSHAKSLPKNAQNLEKAIYGLKKNLEQAEKLHLSINDSIKENRQSSSQKVSNVDLGYLSRLMMNKIYKIPLESQAPQEKHLKTIKEIKDVFSIIKGHLETDIDVYLSIDPTQALKDKQILTKMKKQIEILSTIQDALLSEIELLREETKKR